MECKSCGAQIGDSEHQCPYCKAVVKGQSPPPAVSTQPKKTSGNKTFKVFTNGRQTVAVKQGWSWPAFFFHGFWAFTKGLYLAGIIGLLAVLIPAVALTMADKPGNPALLIVGIIFGIKGNKWWESHLLKNGFSDRGQVKAQNPADAISQIV